MSLEEICRKLRLFPSSVYWIHEKVLCNYLGIPKGRGVHGQADALTCLLACIKQGYGGNQRKQNITNTGLGQEFDLSVQDNGLGICYQACGKFEEFPGGELSSEPKQRRPRWFHFGSDFPIEVKQQIQIVNQLTGNCKVGK